jgi:hypothetical protein
VGWKGGGAGRIWSTGVRLGIQLVNMFAIRAGTAGAQVAIRRSHHVSWQGDGGDDDEAEEVNGYGPLGSFGVEMPTDMGGGGGGGGWHSTSPTTKGEAAATTTTFMLAAKERHGHVHS